MEFIDLHRVGIPPLYIIQNLKSSQVTHLPIEKLKYLHGKNAMKKLEDKEKYL